MYDLESGIAWMVGGGDRPTRQATLPRLALRDGIARIARIARLRADRRSSAVTAACCAPAPAG